MDANGNLVSGVITRPTVAATEQNSSIRSLSRKVTPMLAQGPRDYASPPPAPRRKHRKSSPFARYYERIRTPSEQKRYAPKIKSSKSTTSLPPYPASKLPTEKDAGDAKTKPLSRGASLDSIKSEKAQAYDLERNSPWPSVENLRQQASHAKHQRMSKTFVGQFWASLSQGQRKAARFVLFVVILAIAIALGLGISFAVKGRVVSGVDGLTQPIHGNA